jgi:RNA polymerase sigma factor (sigma-70 family)
MSAEDTIGRVVARLRSRGPSDSVLRDGDRLLRRAEPVARRTVRAVAGSFPESDQEDFVQQVLEIAWRRLPEYDTAAASTFEAWIRGIARNVVANGRRKSRDLLTEDGIVERGDAADSVLAALQHEERDQVVTEAISAALEGVEQDVLYHRYVHGFDRDHIAELLELADANEVRVVLQRAQRHLKAELERRLADLGHGRSFVRTIDG